MNFFNYLLNRKNIYKILGVALSLVFSGVIGWYINYALSHANASVSIKSIDLYYKFPNESDSSFENSKLDFSLQDIETDNSAFNSYDLSLYTTKRP